jgi:hypothetical protein
VRGWLPFYLLLLRLVSYDNSISYRHLTRQQ